MVKRLLSIGAAVVMGVCLFCGLVTLTGCDQMILSTTNERLDETERQLTYRSNAINYYSLEKAYANSWLTQTDIAYAMFYAKGKVYTCKKSDWNSHNTEKIKEIDFAPTEVCPAINEQVEIDIKRYYYDRLSFEEGLDFEEFAENVMFEFVGSYNGTLRMYRPLSILQVLSGRDRTLMICLFLDMNKCRGKVMKRKKLQRAERFDLSALLFL